MTPSRYYSTPSRSFRFGQEDIDYGFEPAWAIMPQPQSAPPVAFGTPSSISRDQMFGTVRKPIWQESKEKYEKELEQARALQLQMELDRSDRLALNSIATLFAVASGLFKIVGTTLVYAGKVLGVVSSSAIKVKKYVASRAASDQLTPMERKIRKKSKKRVTTGQKPVKNTMFDSDSDTAGGDDDSASDTDMAGTQSMLAMPPHMVGATPRIVRESRRARTLAPVPAYSSPIALKSRHKGLKTPAQKRRVRFEDDSTTPGNSRQNSAPNTPAFVFNTPKDKKMQMKKQDEFKMNFRKDDFQPWVDYLHEFGWSRGAFRTALTKFELPTELIMDLYDKRESHPEAWKTLITAHSHDGFSERLRMTVPKVVFPKPIDWEVESQTPGPRVASESRLQQKDGKCVLCRGMSWAGKVYTREIFDGEGVPCLSHHKSVIPYTPGELREITPINHDPVFRRWCQESRWDWIFGEVPLNGLNEDGRKWTIPSDDPRLRHITRLGDPENLAHPTEAVRYAIFCDLTAKYSRQDLAARRFIDGIENAGNLVLAGQLKKMDLERKRQQVDQEWLCVRQVKVVVKSKDGNIRHGRKRSVSDTDLQGNNPKKTRSNVATAQPAREIANQRKLRKKSTGNNKATNAKIIPTISKEPLLKVQVPLDSVELKKIRLAPPVENTITDPDTLFLLRHEQSTRYAPKPIRTIDFSTTEMEPPLSKAELAAEKFNEECARKEELRTLRMEEEMLRRKEIDEDAERRCDNPDTNTTDGNSPPGPRRRRGAGPKSDRNGSGGQKGRSRTRSERQRSRACRNTGVKVEKRGVKQKGVMNNYKLRHGFITGIRMKHLEALREAKEKEDEEIRQLAALAEMREKMDKEEALRKAKEKEDEEIRRLAEIKEKMEKEEALRVFNNNLLQKLQAHQIYLTNQKIEKSAAPAAPILTSNVSSANSPTSLPTNPSPAPSILPAATNRSEDESSDLSTVEETFDIYDNAEAPRDLLAGKDNSDGSHHPDSDSDSDSDSDHPRAGARDDIPARPESRLGWRYDDGCYRDGGCSVIMEEGEEGEDEKGGWGQAGGEEETEEEEEVPRVETQAEYRARQEEAARRNAERLQRWGAAVARW